MTRRSRAFLAAAYITLVGSHALALEKSDVELLRKAVVRGVEGGEVKSAYITFGGAPARVRVKAADAQGLTIVMSGARIPLSWDKVEARYLAGMASKAAASASEWWALGELYGEIGKPEEADKAHRKAAGLDGDYRKKLDAMLAASRSKATPARPRVALGTSRRAKTPSVKETDLKFPPWKGPTPERKLRTDRPRLLITPERSRYLRSSGRSLPSYGAMKPYCRSHPTSDYYAPMQALVYLVEGDEVFGRMAIDNVKRNAVRRGVDRNLNSCFPKLGRTALVYDWCYPLLSDADKDAFRKWMVSQYDAMAKTYSGEHYHNYHSAAAYAFGLAGYALHGDDPKAAEMIRNGVRERFENGILKTFAQGNAGGAWAEGEGYSYTTVPDVILLAEAIRTCEGIDHFDSLRGRSFYYGRLAYMMFAVYPGVHPPPKMVFFVRGDGVRGGNTLDARQNLISLIYAYAGTRLASYAEDFVSDAGYARSPYRDGLWMDVLWSRPGHPRLPVRNFRLSHHAKGQGVVLMKSDWTHDATFVSFICGDHYSYHQHADSGAFTIVRDGAELAVDSGEYDGNGSSSHAKNYHSRSIAHNSIVLSGHEGGQVRARGIGPADDGGQLTPKAERFYETGDIIAYDPQRAYTYVAGDLTKSFNGRLGLWTRHLLFVRPEYVVVFDVVRSSPQHRPRWLLHTWNDPAVTGDSFRAEKDAGALHGKVVLPARHRISRLRGFRVAGREYPPGRARGGTAQWRLEVTPENPAGTTAYLVVMQATKSSVKQMVPVKPLEGGGIGCTIGPNITVRFNSNGAPGGEITLRGKSYKLATRVLPDIIQ